MPGQKVSDGSVSQFWTEEVRKVSSFRPSMNYIKSSPKSYSVSETVDVSRAPVFLYYKGGGEGFVVANDLQEKDFPDFQDKGDMSVGLVVQRIKLSERDQYYFRNLRSGSLRIDLQQATPLPSLAEALAWSSVAALFPDRQGRIPQLPTMRFDPGTTWGKFMTIPLPKGQGLWTWNFFVQEKESFWHKAAGLLRKANELVVPVLGLPAIAITALKQFDKFFGYLQTREAQANWLFQSQDVPVVVTKEARQRWFESAMPLVKGQYVVVPQSDLSAFGEGMQNYELVNGLVVPRGTRRTDVVEAALSTAPGVTYMSIEVAVTK
jgi:hypothetical protein